MYNFLTEFTYTNGTAFPGTAAVNASGSGTADGTEFKKKFVDDLWGAFQALLDSTGQTPTNTAEAYNSSQVLDAVKLFSGVYEYESGMILKSGTRVMSPIPGDYMFYHVTGDATAANTADAIADFKTDLSAGRFRYHAPISRKRHAITQGAVDGNGKAAFLSISGTGVLLTASSVPVAISIASGYGPGGHPIDRTIVITANQTPTAWNALSDGVHYLYKDFNNGTVLEGESTLRPIYGTVFPSTPAAGQHYFSINEMKMYYWSGSAWIQTDRIFIGQATFSGGSPTEVRTYALSGRYDSGWFAVAAFTNYTIYHDIGVPSYQGISINMEFSLDSAGADAFAAPAQDFNADTGGNYYGHYMRENTASSNTELYIKFGFGQFIYAQYRGTNRASGYYRIIAQRSF
ncbi:hypothetical protein GWN42_31325 [candidate division KSB1 bacterium]|nr:hypothetical protein [Phycisphaerae bacterium]NIQ92551.1 hypothetical protein [Deltaproteobacteria bacterium]NIV97161.1 hypothetical protein [candidate division KSB1 bacterium]